MTILLLSTTLLLQAPSTTFGVISLIATVASLILAIGAIWLSVVFYKMSVAASNSTTEAAKGIASSVERLEKLFDKLYSDTFSMMRDTVSDMRKHMWPEDDADGEKAIELAEQKADEKFSELRRSMEGQLASILQRQKITEDKFLNVQNEMRGLLDRAINRSRQAETEARDEALREFVLRAIRVVSQTHTVVHIDDIVENLREKGISPTRILRELRRMRNEELVHFNSDVLQPSTEVRLRASEALPADERHKRGD